MSPLLAAIATLLETAKEVVSNLLWEERTGREIDDAIRRLSGRK